MILIGESQTQCKQRHKGEPQYFLALQSSGLKWLLLLLSPLLNIYSSCQGIKFLIRVFNGINYNHIV